MFVIKLFKLGISINEILFIDGQLIVAKNDFYIYYIEIKPKQFESQIRESFEKLDIENIKEIFFNLKKTILRDLDLEQHLIQ